MPSQPESIAITGSDTYQTLLARAHRQTGGVPPDLIVRHVLSVTGGGDWPVHRDALEAVLRRCASAHADEIEILRRPRRRLPGLYATRRAGSPARPYRTLLRRTDDDGAERELEAVVASGDESRDRVIDTAPGPADSAAAIQRLVAGVTVRRTANGGLAIEAPPETASTLAALFSGMAQLLQAAAAPPPAGGRPAGRR